MIRSVGADNANAMICLRVNACAALYACAETSKNQTLANYLP
ncbi:hypothetical protein BRPE64_BCDS06460 [Caballeronia insecticola]|uniref:Uncharacterized protein n=1 Tax=Caballeronia insecticola TaxID=758793 RepID=R4X206_9BURK|nr:hypothetical protein BRPE64_BCDS06460 [Caballeronia insecticola]